MHPIIEEKYTQTTELELAGLLTKIQEFIKPNLLLFYTDFTISCIIGNFFLWLSAQEYDESILWVLYALAAAFALFRASVFIHEAAHSGKKIRWFSQYYNLIHGFLHKAPLYIYKPHHYHHAPRTYGTLDDPEYDNLGNRSFFYVFIFGPFILMPVSPLFFAFRWSIVPLFLPFIGEKGRIWVFQHLSTLAMNLRYVRSAPNEVEKKEWYAQDIGCCVYSVIIMTLIITEFLPWSLLISWYLTIYFLSLINYIRVLLSHRYLTNFEPTDHKRQVLDSVTFPLGLTNILFYPVGLGYHALHHMFPQIPYHNMDKVHQMLLRELPKNHPYRVTLIKSYYSGLNQLLTKKF